tara:strand:- start:577 stop:4578 length:4002 start_codon:yes stop_codon:yes gene_type:complete
MDNLEELLSDFSADSHELFNLSPKTREQNYAEPTPTFLELGINVMADRVAPIVEFGVQRQEFGNMPYDPNFSWSDNIGDYDIYSADLALARNLAEMEAMKAQIDRTVERRRTASMASGWQNFKSGLLDPINVVAIPFRAAGVLQSAFRGGVSVAAVEASFGAVNVLADPVVTAADELINVAAGAVMGAGFGAGAGAFQTRAIRQIEVFQEEMQAGADRISYTQGLTREQITNPTPQAERPLGDVPTEELEATVQAASEASQAMQGPNLNPEEAGGAYLERNELGLRQLEELGPDVYTAEGGFNYKSSWFTNSIFYRAIPTPLKRIFQGNYSDNVQEIFARSFHDGGVTFAKNTVGDASPQSVAVRAAVHQGRWVSANDQMLSAFARDTSASPVSLLDINLTNTSRAIRRAPNTYRAWLDDISTRRINNDTENMSEGQLEALGVMNKYFEDSEVRLESVGLLMNSRGMARKIEMLSDEVAELKASLSGVMINSAEYRLVQDRIELLESRSNGLQNMGAEQTNPAEADVFFPRFYDMGAIKGRREEFASILYKHFSNNPFRYDVDAAGNATKVRFSTEPDAIAERVNQTIRNILGEKDPLDLETVSFGAGRSKHFRQRQLDIPNSLITDFIMTDPLAAMKTYAARIEPRYEYAYQFGKDVDSVRFDLERQMLRDNNTEKEINAAMRDYNHMYSRTVGSVLENPDKLNQKIATVLREAASFSYMGSSGIAAIPDFGRIVMEYEMDNVWKGVQALLDKERVNMTVNEIRLAGEAIDILKGSAHMRLQEDMSNNIDASSALNSTRNAFYILNGLAPMTVLAKQLAGVIDAHQIIEYSIKLTDGQLDNQGIEWLARYGIGKDTALLISKAPYEKTENGFYMANTEAWASDEFLNSILDQGFGYSRPRTRFSAMTDRQLTNYFQKQFPVKEIITDPNVVKPYFLKLQEEQGYENLSSFINDHRGVADFINPEQDAGFSVYIDKDIVRDRYQNIVDGNIERQNQNRIDVQKALDEGNITEEAARYLQQRINNEIDTVKLFENADDYLEYVMLDELHHSIINRKANETIEDFGRRVRDSAVAYVKDQRASGERLARHARKVVLVEEQEELVMKFRAALNSGVLNTIMSGTPADKPIITDGVVYIPMSVASKFGMKEHPNYRGYARIENGLLGLPFQFYSFALANVNKTVGALAQGQIRNRAIGSATMMGLAYMSMQLRTPEYIWDEMSAQDKFARTFDMSGIMALYSDLFYTSMHTSLALGGPNIAGGFISPKFNQEGSVADGITGLSGAGPSWGYTMSKGIIDFASGDYGQASSDIVRNLPFSNLWFLKDQVNQVARGMRE